MTGEEKLRLFDKLDEIRDSTIRVEERVSHLKGDFSELKSEFDSHEKLGEKRYQHLGGSLAKIQNEVHSLEKAETSRKKSWLTPKTISAVVTALVGAVGGIWALLRGNFPG